MALCRSRLIFGTKLERRSQDSSLVQTLNFQDSDDGDFETEYSSSHDASMDSPSCENCSGYFDSGLGTPTPKQSPRKLRRSPRGRLRSPVPLNFDDSDDDPVNQDGPTSPRFTPPHKKLKSLRLYDTPHTPKSLLQKAQRRMTRINRVRLNPLGKESCHGSRLSLDPSRPQANVNPFTPSNTAPVNLNMSSGTLKRGRTSPDRLLDDSVDDEMEDDMPTHKKLALHEINLSRYNEEFHEVCKLGDGEFGSVYKCIHRLDGCTYAIKKSKMPVAGSAYERNALNEVYAHAVLGKHQHVVRYYSAWAENDHMYIQNEYCNGGSLAEVVNNNRQEGRNMSELELKQLLSQGAQGLRYIHSQNLVHLDIKPGNIFIHRNPKTSSTESGFEDDFLEEEGSNYEETVIYKIGDLGHVTSLTNPSVEEGDCRYLPREILQEQFDHLPKADIFSLALTVYEAACNCDLPKNGDLWHKIRKGEFPHIEHLSKEFNQLLQKMINPDPSERPSAVTLFQHSALCPAGKKTKAQLRRELNEERMKNQLLSRQLLEATRGQMTSNPVLGRGKSSRLIGKKVNRSVSMTYF